MKISFIGFGNMAKAIAQSLEQNPELRLFAASPSLAAVRNTEGISTHHNNIAVIDEADVIILGVKPVAIPDVLKEISPFTPKQAVIVSIAAGVSLAKLSQYCKPTQAIIRCMPNTPIAVGKGATAMIANTRVCDKQKFAVEKILQYSSITHWVTNENDMDIITALSGSGPAYVFLFLEAMSNAAINLGLEEEIAKTFTLQTLSGALALIETTGQSPASLRKKVTSPAGTTAAAIAILQENGFEALIQAAIKAAYDRSIQLNKTR